MAFAADPFISSGGTVETAIIDIKGEPVIGYSNGLGLGGIYTLIPPGLTTTTSTTTTTATTSGPATTTTTTTGTTTTTQTGPEVADSGWIRETNIRREGNDLVLTWGYDPSKPLPAGVKVYAESGAGSEYQPSAAAFTVDLTAAAPLPNSQTSLTLTGAGKDGNNHYYRVVPNPLVTGTDLLNEQNNSITVGKVEVTTNAAGGFVFTSLPFQEDGVSLKALVADQVNVAGSMLLWWNGSQYELATFSSGDWTGDHSLKLAEGFILYTDAAAGAKSVSLTGRFGKLATTNTRPVITGYNLIAFPYPRQRTTAQAGLTALTTGDLLLTWDRAGQQFTLTTYSGGAWGDAAQTALKPAESKFYYSGSAFDWTLIYP
ncbi:MAG: hypothetical protein WC529_04610 [Candidatus Margulisiibacteriota bacterium]